jgi:glucose dehydrogenase
MVVGDLLVQTTENLRGDAEVSDNGSSLLHARDKRTGEILASVELPVPGQYGMMTYLHDGKPYIVVQSGSAKGRQPGSLVALTLP